jgi:holliday junction DNA helicase RuvA
MIERLRGEVALRSTDGTVLDVGGVGFRLEASATTLRDVPEVGSACTLFTHLYVREDALQLFGFSTVEERDLFLLLIGVSKIGPRLALAVLSARKPSEIRRGLALGDVALFQAVPGIGKKTAERLILELKEKVGDLTMPTGAAGPRGLEPSAEDDRLAVARAALQELGLALIEADQLLRGADPEAPVAALVKYALGRRRQRPVG